MRILAVLLLLLLAPLGAAEDHHEDAAEEAVENEAENGDEWEYSISVSGGTASIEMSRESGESERAIEFEYNRDDAYVEFSMESETGEIESEASMEVQFHQLLEYEDDNGNGQFDDGETIVQAFDLADGEEEQLADGSAVSWSAISRTEVMSDNGVAGAKLSSSANVGGGTLRFDFYIFADEASLGPASVEATEIKLDIIIDAFPYESQSSALAVFLETESEAEIENDSDVEGDEEGVVANAGDAQLVFAWKDFADVDGVETSVKTTRLSSETSQGAGEYENEELLVFSYARGDSIVHDPTMGVSSGGSKGAPAPGIALVIAGIAALALIRRK